METLQTWYMGLEPTLQIFWACAVISSAIFLVQLILTFVGIDHDIDFDTPDFDGDTLDAGGALSLFSLRSFINFFIGFGWTGISFYDTLPAKWQLYALAVAVGCVFASLFFVMRKKLMRLEANGAYDINDALGKEAEVYLRIPESRTGNGKVQVSLGGSIHELPALTDGPTIPSGSRIRILEILGNKTLLVEKI